MWASILVIAGVMLAMRRRMRDHGGLQQFGEDFLPLILLFAVSVTGLMLTARWARRWRALRHTRNPAGTGRPLPDGLLGYDARKLLEWFPPQVSRRSRNGKGAMMSTADHTLFAKIVGLNGIAFGERRYGMAYHLLMAALHCAVDDADETRLAEVATRFRDHRDCIDALVPPHKYSTGAAHMGRSIFELGASQAESVRSRIQSVERFRRNYAKDSEG